MANITPELLKDLRIKANAATKGHWTWDDDGNNTATVYSGREPQKFIDGHFTMGMHGLNLLGRLNPDWNGKNNLDFICASSPEIILALLDYIER